MVVMSRLLSDHVVQRLATGPGRVGPITDLMSSLAVGQTCIICICLTLVVSACVVAIDVCVFANCLWYGGSLLEDMRSWHAYVKWWSQFDSSMAYPEKKAQIQAALAGSQSKQSIKGKLKQILHLVQEDKDLSPNEESEDSPNEDDCFGINSDDD
ncbi:hypothetical protein PIB30_060065 [Stylosanthes scabra]|uniref:Uncharacterized protein n=1 Tax=Stylosanthes scabra TaxID=79078 RepID=A0ABU6RKU6_9FABA|nr:hypothetical protein [Stylosanthes scabra]